MANTTIGYSDDFTRSMAKLDLVTKGKAYNAMLQFSNNPRDPGLHLEQLENCADDKISSIRIDLHYRIILREMPAQDTYVFLYAASHDEAYRWAKNKRVAVNEAVTTLQVYNVPEEAAPAAGGGLFPNTRYSDRTLARLGVPEEQFALVRSIRDTEHLLEQEAAFSPDVLERLFDLSEGTALSDVLSGIEANKAAAPDGDSLRSPETLRAFTFWPSDPTLQRAITEGSLEQWRVFLHPAQRKLVQGRFDGPVLVLGGAGTGKTITALYRAKELAARMIEEKVEGKILFTFYTSNLIDDNIGKLRSICTPQEFNRIDMVNIDKVLFRLLCGPGCERLHIVYSKDRLLVQAWEDAVSRAAPTRPFPTAFYQREWENIVTERETFTLEEYLRVNRIGGGVPLLPAQREQVWQVFEVYQQLMAERELIDNKMAMVRCRQRAAAQPGTMYRHVIADESQDFTAGAFRLLRELAGEPHPDDLFLVGDSWQRIYDRRVSMSSCGVDVRGRIQRLWLNYRTTYELQRAAVRLLSGDSFDNLNGENDDSRRYFSCTSGAAPQVRHFPTEEEEFQWILEQMRELVDSGVPHRDICLAACTNRLVRGYSKRLNDAGFQPYELKRTDDRDLGGVRIGTMHRIKGLEFQYMFIAGVNKGVIPPKEARQAGLKQAKCLLYVALTRAQKGAYVSGFGRTRSEFLTALMDEN